MKAFLAKRLFVTASIVTLSAAAMLSTARTASAQGEEIIGCGDVGCDKASGTVCCEAKYCPASGCFYDFLYRAC